MLVCEVLEGFLGIWPNALFQHDESDRQHLLGGTGLVDRHRGPAQQQHAPARLADRGGPGREFTGRVEQDVGRANQPVARIAARCVGKRQAAPLERRRERLHRRRRPIGLVAERLPDGLDARVGARVGGRDCRERGVQLFRTDPRTVDRRHLRQPHPVLGQRAGLVGAHDVDTRQAFDSGQFIDQTLPLAEANYADCECDRRHQNQAFGDHRNERRDHAEDSRLDRLPRQRAIPRDEQLVDDREDPGRNQQIGDDLKDLVDAGAQLGVDKGELRRLGGQLRGVRVGADLRRPVRPRAGDDEAAGQDLVANGLVDRVRFAGEE